MKSSATKGASLIEVVVALAVIIIVITGVISTYPFLFRTSLATIDRVSSVLLIEEGIEAMKIMRDTSWSSSIATLTTGSAYRLSYTGTTWTTTAAHTMIDGYFDRTIKLDPVYRDVNDNIAGSGTLDLRTKKLTVEVFWRGRNGTTSRAISTYITDLFAN